MIGWWRLGCSGRTQSRSWRRRLALLVTASVALVTWPGCSAGPRQLTVVIDDRAMVSDFGEPLPVPLRLLCLRRPETFRDAPLAPLWADPVGVLGADLLAEPQRVVFAAGERRALELDDLLAPDTAWLGLHLHGPDDGASRRVLVPIDGAAAIVVHISSNGLNIRANPAAP